MGKRNQSEGAEGIEGEIVNPSFFCVNTLGLIPYQWQAEAMEAVAEGLFTSVVAANGSGKTDRLVAPLVIWFLSQFPSGKVVFTSGSYRQLANQLWPAIKRHRKHFPQWNFLSEEIRTPDGGFALGFSTDDAGRAEGWHGDDDSPLFLIVDEAKTVPDEIFQAFDRCTRVFQLWVSSPGAPRGQFYDSHHSLRSQFWTRKVRSDECPHISAEKREKDLQTYGIDHPWYRSAHLAEFTADVDRLILPPERLAKALESQPGKEPSGEIVAFCDFAAGRDENVLAMRTGNCVSIIKAWVEKDTMQAAREFLHQFRLNGLQPGQVWGDADGLGTVMIDAIEELGFFMNRFHGGQRASDPEQYANLIGEVWHVAAREIERGRIHLGQLDPISFRQLTTRKSEWTITGKLRCESKDKMAKEGIESPDRADAIAGAIGCGARLSGAVSAKNLAYGESKTSPSNEFTTAPITW